MTLEEIREKIAALIIPHHSCEDSWYSCPKSSDGCADSDQGNDCNCGADSHNARIAALLSEIDAAIAEERANKVCASCGHAFEVTQWQWQIGEVGPLCGDCAEKYRDKLAEERAKHDPLKCNNCENGPSFSGCFGCFPPEYKKYKSAKPEPCMVCGGSGLIHDSHGSPYGSVSSNCPECSERPEPPKPEPGDVVPKVCGNCKHGKSTSIDDIRCYKATPYLPTGLHCEACADWESCRTYRNPRAADVRAAIGEAK